MSVPKWIPIESNPDVMNKYLWRLGVPEHFGFCDIPSLDDEFLQSVPYYQTTSDAVLLLLPVTENYNKYVKEREELLTEVREEVEEAYFMKQTIKNACGTVALIHAVLNNLPKIELMPDSILERFMESTINLTPEERGRKLEENIEISHLHEAGAQEGQTEAPDSNNDSELHFITFVNVLDRLVELDGRKSCPIVHQITNSDNFFNDAASVCRQYMARDSGSLQFSALSFGLLC